MKKKKKKQGEFSKNTDPVLRYDGDMSGISKTGYSIDENSV